MTDATDYTPTREQASWLSGIVLLPHPMRTEAIAAFEKEHGALALVELMSQLVGMANSVAANCREMAEMLLVTEGGLHPHEAENLNMPTMFGAAQGAMLAAGLESGKACPGCAFRLGSVANQCPSTVCDADLCAHPCEADFYCHEGVAEGEEPRRKCPGWARKRRQRSEARP